MSEMFLRVVYRPVSRDLANRSTHFGDEECIDLVEFEEVRDTQFGRHVVGTAADGRDIVVWLGSGRVRARDGDEGTFDQNLGKVDRLKGLTATARSRCGP